MSTHSPDAAEEHHTEEHKQVGRCAAVPLLALDLTSRAEGVITLSHPVAESDWYLVQSWHGGYRCKKPVLCVLSPHSWEDFCQSWVAAVVAAVVLGIRFVRAKCWCVYIRFGNPPLFMARSA